MTNRDYSSSGAEHLGSGTYGQVSNEGGYAVKRFSNYLPMVAEYAMLKTLGDCPHVVKMVGADLRAQTITMELYDLDMGAWLTQHSNNGTMKEIRPQLIIAIRSIMEALYELHRRDLVHGDIKPDNILVRLNPFKVVLGDCGFTSIKKYARIEHTAKVYRSDVLSRNGQHDIYSFAVILAQLSGFNPEQITGWASLTKLAVRAPATLEGRLLRRITESPRGTVWMEDLLKEFFDHQAQPWRNPYSLNAKDCEQLVAQQPQLYKETADIIHGAHRDLVINRRRCATYGLYCYLLRRNLGAKHRAYSYVVLHLCSILFGREVEANRITYRDAILVAGSKEAFFEILNELLQSERFLGILMCNLPPAYDRNYQSRPMRT